MTSSSFSPIEEINAALKTHNPLAQPPYVGRDEVWDKEFPDITSLNAHASDAVFQAIEQIRANQYPRTSIDVSNPPKIILNIQEVYEILIELSSPLTGYLGRNQGTDWKSDKFYFLRDLAT